MPAPKEDIIDSEVSSAPEAEADPSKLVQSKITFLKLPESAPLETPSVEETFEVASINGSTITQSSSALAVDDLSSSLNDTATEKPLISDDILPVQRGSRCPRRTICSCCDRGFEPH